MIRELVRTVHRLRAAVLAPRATFRYVLDPTVRGRRARLEALRGRYRGRACFLMGNGPSLNEMDLERFSGHPVWGSNRCYLLFDRMSWRPSFYVSVDRRVTPGIAGGIHRMIEESESIKFFFPVRYRRDGVLRSKDLVYWYDEVSPDAERGAEGAFSLDAASRVYSAPTVTLAQMQPAAFLGFDPIYLIAKWRRVRSRSSPLAAQSLAPELWRIPLVLLSSRRWCSSSEHCRSWMLHSTSNARRAPSGA